MKNKIYTLRKLLLIATILVYASISATFATTYTFSGTGSWTDETKWSPSYPGTDILNSDQVTIATGAECTIQSGLFNIRFSDTSTLINNGTITNPGIISIQSSGATLINNGTLNISYYISLYGKLINNPGANMVFTYTGRFIIYSGGIFENKGTCNDGLEFYNSGGGTITNTGIINLSVSQPGNDGTFNQNAGELNIQSRYSTSIFAGTFNWNGGTVAFDTYGIVLTDPLVIPSGETLQINSAATIGSGGSIYNNGTLSIRDLYGSLTINLGGNLTLNTIPTTIPARVLWNGGTLTIGTNGNFTISSSFDIGADKTFSVDGTVNVNPGATMTINSGGTLSINSGSSFTNSGILNLNSGGNLLLNKNPASLPGGTFNWNGGTVTIGSSGNFALSSSFTIATGNNFTINGTVPISSSGTLIGSSGSTITINGSLVSSGTLTNNGTLNLNTGGNLQLNKISSTIPGGTFNWNSGSKLTIGSSGSLSIANSFAVQADRTLQVDGSLTITATGSLTNSGILKGSGTIIQNGAFTNNSTGSIAPGASPGSFTVTGDLNLGSGTYNCDINGTVQGTSYDLLSISGIATLSNANLVVDWGTFVPSLGDAFTILQYTDRVDELPTVSIPTFPDVLFRKTYSNNSLVITAQGNIPYVATTTPTNITANSATCGGNDIFIGGSNITEKGICWSTSPSPTLADSKITGGSGTSDFSSSITGLSEGTTYYVRAYATNSYGTSYGNEISFTTACPDGILPFAIDYEGAFPVLCWENIGYLTIGGNLQENPPTEWKKTDAASAYGTGTSSIYFNSYYFYSGVIADYISRTIDLGGSANAFVKFDHAYASAIDRNDRLELFYSTDDGTTYTSLITYNGGNTGPLNTGGNVYNSEFFPTSTQWATKQVQLPAGTNKVKFRAYAEKGNNMFIDNISFFTTSAMTYTSSTATQTETTQLGRGTINQKIIGLEVVTTNFGTPLSLTNITMNTNGTTAPATDITNAKIYYTGISNTFATSAQFGSTVASPNGTFNMTGTQQLSEGTNYFWLTYDIPSDAVAGNSVDAECTQITIGSNFTPTITAPTGVRNVADRMIGNYTVGLGTSNNSALNNSKENYSNNITSTNSAGDYATITEAITDLNATGISGPVTFTLLDNNYPSETFPIVINEITGASSANTITIKPADGATTTISGSSTSAILKLNGTDYFTLDGSNNGTSSRDLTITNTSTDQNTAPIWLASLGASAGSANNVIKNCNLSAGSKLSTTYGIFSGGATIGAEGSDNDNISIQNNSINNAYYGISAKGYSYDVHDNIIVSGNDVGNMDNVNTSITYCGIYLSLCDNVTISGNHVMNVYQPTSGGEKYNYGIFVGDGVQGNISKNIVESINYAGGDGGSGRGIVVNPPSWPSYSIGITNNVIFNILGDGNAGWNNGGGLAGIYVAGEANGIGIYYNSINLSGTLTYSAACTSANIYLAGMSGVDLVNNILVNSITHSTQSTSKAYNVFSYMTFDEINNNNYYINSGSQGFVGYFGYADRVDLAALRSATGQDKNSISADPGFTSATNLKPNTANSNSWTVSGSGKQLAGISTDITGASRPTTAANGTPDMGAYEFDTPSVDPITTTSNVVAGSNNIMINGQNLLTLDFTTLGGVPSVNVKFFSGTIPPNLSGSSANVLKGYFTVTPTSGSSFKYNITYFYSETQLGNLLSEADIRLSKSTDGGSTWTTYSVSGTGDGEYQLDTDANSITVYGLTSFSTYILSDQSAPLPVELSFFTAKSDNRNVLLNWTTATEINNYGFEIERTIVIPDSDLSENKDLNNWETLGFVPGHGNSNSPNEYTYVDESPLNGAANYRLKQIDTDGTFTYSEILGVEIILPTEYELSQNYPNPFNPTTTIKYSIPNTVIASEAKQSQELNVTLKVYDILGNEVAELVNEKKEAGKYTVKFNAGNLASGVYFSRFNSGSYSAIIKMLLIK